MNDEEYDEEYYNRLADLAEQGKLEPIPGTALYGAEARASARKMLKWATNTTDTGEMRRVLQEQLKSQDEKGSSGPAQKPTGTEEGS